MSAKLIKLRKALKAKQARLKAILAKPADQRDDAEKKTMGLLTEQLPKLKARVEALVEEQEGDDKATAALKAVTGVLKAGRGVPLPTKGKATKSDEDAAKDRLDLDVVESVLAGRRPGNDGAVEGGAVKASTIGFGLSETEKKYLTGGFKSLGHFSLAVIKASNGSVESMRELGEWQSFAVKAASGMGINLDNLADFLVPVEFSQSVYSRVFSDSSLVSRVRRQTIRGNTFVVWSENDYNRSDAGTRHGGVRVYWEDEGDALTRSTPDKSEKLEFKLRSMKALVRMTNEIIEDSAMALDQYVDRYASQAIDDELSRTIFEGDGVNKPKGAFRAGQGSLISIAKETGQEAATVLRQNINKMFNAMHPSSRARAVWMINNEVEPLLEDMVIPVGTGGVPVYMPPGGMADAAYGRLKGRPVIVNEYCAAAGTVTDISLADWDAYQLVIKGQTRRDISMHARFENDESCIKFVFRCDGQPLWRTVSTPLKGSRTTSPFVALATRA